MENLESSIVDELADAIENMGAAMGRLKVAYAACMADGMNQTDIRDAIIEKIPENERGAFLQQWPMISMMLAAL